MKYIFSRQGEWLDYQRKGKGKYFHKDGLMIEVNFDKQGIYSFDLNSRKVVIQYPNGDKFEVYFLFKG